MTRTTQAHAERLCWGRACEISQWSWLLLFAALALFPGAVAQGQSPASLAIDDVGPVPGNATVDVPIVYTTGPTQVSAFVFSIDFDQTCLAFDPVDADADFIPDNVIFSAAIPAAYAKTVFYSPADSDGELDLAVFSFGLAPPAIPSGTLLTVRFTTTCTPAPATSYTAPVTFSSSPSPSFSSPAATAVPVTTVAGSVLISTPATPVTPVEPTVTVIDACGEYGSVVFATTPGVTYSMVPANATEGIVVVSATAQAGYVLQGYTGPWTYDLGTYSACLVPVTPVEPTVTVIDACGEYGSVVFANTPGVTYSMVPANATQGVVTVHATAQAGYVLQGYTGPWTYNLGTYSACPIPVTPVQPTVTVIDACNEYGSVVFANTPGVTYSMVPANAREGTVVVSATAKPGYVLQNYTGPWTYNLGTYEACPTTPAGIHLPIVRKTAR